MITHSVHVGQYFRVKKFILLVLNEMAAIYLTVGLENPCTLVISIASINNFSCQAFVTKTYKEHITEGQSVWDKN